jgi:hypothetical protein
MEGRFNNPLLPLKMVLLTTEKRGEEKNGKEREDRNGTGP